MNVADDPPTTDRAGGSLIMLRGLLLDVGLPVAGYYLLHLFGASDWLALLVASGLAATRVAWSALRNRTLNAFALIMLLVCGIGLTLALLTGDPRTLLLRTSFITAAVGVVFLVTAARGRRPLTLAATQSFDPARAAQAAHEYATSPAARRAHRLLSTVWGVGLLIEALARIPLVYLLPIPVAVGLTEALTVIVLVGIVGWTAWYSRRLRGAG
ncbi:VC0807 family protein [Pseudonocardia sp. NPDC049635]|uniref:VC0807 family protein n=1 Tax=Pseudonocardia sp. NPDC049635 TaxID=3155506 RepID=UPI0033ED62CE